MGWGTAVFFTCS